MSKKTFNEFSFAPVKPASKSDITPGEFFRNELKKIFEDSSLLRNPRFIGRSCFANISDNLCARIEFDNPFSKDYYISLNLSVINPAMGLVDHLELKFGDVFVIKSGPDNYISAENKRPHIRVVGDELKWYPKDPSEADYKLLRECAENYFDVFRPVELQKSLSVEKEDLSPEVWITVYKDTLGFPDDLDNLTEILVPRDWLIKELESENVSFEDWRNVYTADDTDVFVPKALKEGVILDCTNVKIKEALLARQASGLNNKIRDAEKRSGRQAPSKSSGFEFNL